MSLPTGLIIIWSGTLNTVPAGWLVCDGSNNTPNLKNRFIIGAGSTFNLNAQGGSANSIVPTHNHSVGSITTGGAHGHTISPFTVGSGSTNGIKDTANFGLSTSKVTTSASAGSGNHAHTGGTVNDSGVDGTNKNLPPYYSLFYIMKGGA